MKEIPLRTLPLDSRFIVHLETSGRDIYARLIRLNPCSATVSIDAPVVDGTGQTIISGGYQHWSPETLVIPIKDGLFS